MKIEIRHAEPEDAEALQAIYTDEALYANTLQLPMPSKTLWRKRLADIPDNMYVLVAEVEGEVVGRALITAALDLADNWLDTRRIEITTYTDNTGAIGLYKSLGFVIEGEMVDYAYRNGEYVNAYQMARIRKARNG